MDKERASAISLKAKDYYKKTILTIVQTIEDEDYLAKIYAILKYHNDKERK